MKVRRSWHRELPLPRGERVGVRGFGRFRIILQVRTPSSCPSPLWGEGTQRAGRDTPLSARRLSRARHKRRETESLQPRWSDAHASLFRPAAAYDRSASGRNTWAMTSYRFWWSAAGRSGWRLPAISAGAALPARWSSRATARSISRAWIWSASAPWNSAGAGALCRRSKARPIRATTRRTISI